MPKDLKLLIFAAFISGLSWIILVPVWQYSDEQAHFSQMQNIAELGQSKPQGDSTSQEIATLEQILGTDRQDGNNKYTYHPEYHIEYSKSTLGLQEATIFQLPFSARTNLVKDESTANPPLYYFLGSLFYRAVYQLDLFTRIYSARFFSLLLFTALVAVTYKSAQIIFEKNRFLVFTLTALVAYKPMLTFASTGVLPDPLTNLLFSIVLYTSLLVIKNGAQRKYLLLITIAVIAGLFTRQQFLLSTPIIFIALLYDVVKRKKNVKMYIFAIALLIAGIIGSNHVSNIPVLNSLHIPEFLVFEFGKFLKPDLFTYLAEAMKKSYAETWPWYWGVYKWLSFTPPHITYEVINRVVLIAIAGVLLKILQAFRKRKFDQQFFIFAFLIVSSAIYFSAFILWDFFFREHKGYTFGFQGRYFFPLVIFQMAIILTGVWEVALWFFKKYAPFALVFLVLAMMVFNNISLYSLAATYYSFESIGTFVAQASQYKPLFFKDKTIIFLLSGALLGQALVIYQMFRLASKARI